MATVTPNFNWPVPTSTDLVKDGATAMEALGDAIDTSMVDLKGGTTGQVLAKATSADMDFVWTDANPGDITGVTATSPLTGGGTSGTVTVGIQSASTTQLGAVQLSDSTSTTSSTLAATSTAVKSSYDLAAAAIPLSTVTTAGDIIYATGSGAVTRRGIGSTGQVLTVSGGVPTWSTPATSGFVGALATASNTNLSITAGTVTVLALSGEEFDTDSFHSTTTNTSRMTIPSGKAGKYLLTAYFDFQFPAAGQYYMVRFSKNGTNLSSINRGFCGNVGGNQFQGGTISTIVDAAVGDYYEVNLQEGNTETLQFWVRFGIQYLGA